MTEGKVKILSKKESQKLMDKWSSPEYLQQRLKATEAVCEMFKEETKIWDYCFKNNCSPNDLIKAHKNLTIKK